MNNDWRYTAVSVTKYNPSFRDENGYFNKSEWTGFFQIGKAFNGEELTFKSYLIVEEKYIKAAICFFKFHNCKEVVLKSLEKYDHSEYNYADREELILAYNKITDGCSISVTDLEVTLKLILREWIWGELFCSTSSDVVLRFGYDLYMYLNTNRNMDDLLKMITDLGLFVE